MEQVRDDGLRAQRLAAAGGELPGTRPGDRAITSSPRHLVTSSYHRALVQVMAWYHIMTVITSSPHHLIISSHRRVLVQAAAIMDEAMAGGEPVPPTQQRVLALLSEKTVCRISS